MISTDQDLNQVDISATRPIDQLFDQLMRFGRPSPDTLARHIVDYALAFAKHHGCHAAASDVLELSKRFDLTLDELLQISLTLSDGNNEFAATSLLPYYLRNGGAHRAAYENQILWHATHDQDDQVITIFNNSQKWINWRNLRKDILFFVSNAYLKHSKYKECFTILSYLIDNFPDEVFFKENMIILASKCNHKEATSYFRDLIEQLSRRFLSDPPFSSLTPPSVEVDLKRQSEDKILEALRHYGLCHLKNACNVEIAAGLLTHIQAKEQSQDFPCHFDSYVMERCLALLQFDAPAIIGAVLGGNTVIDPETSIIRKVDPGDNQSFTPFHQDTTAFQKAVVNIWTPLTPAGGEYPTIEFVKRRLASAEHTLETSDGYNLVKIDDAEILAKYKDDLFEPKDVAPGDCVLFLGTTIHRSKNLRAAVKPRYNLEIRWS